MSVHVSAGRVRSPWISSHGHLFFSLFVKRLNFDQDRADPELGTPDDSQGFTGPGPSRTLSESG